MLPSPPLPQTSDPRFTWELSAADAVPRLRERLRHLTQSTADAVAAFAHEVAHAGGVLTGMAVFESAVLAPHQPWDIQDSARALHLWVPSDVNPTQLESAILDLDMDEQGSSSPTLESWATKERVRRTQTWGSLSSGFALQVHFLARGQTAADAVRALPLVQMQVYWDGQSSDALDFANGDSATALARTLALSAAGRTADATQWGRYYRPLSDWQKLGLLVNWLEFAAQLFAAWRQHVGSLVSSGGRGAMSSTLNTTELFVDAHEQQLLAKGILLRRTWLVAGELRDRVVAAGETFRSTLAQLAPDIDGIGVVIWSRRSPGAPHHEALATFPPNIDRSQVWVYRPLELPGIDRRPDASDSDDDDDEDDEGMDDDEDADADEDEGMDEYNAEPGDPAPGHHVFQMPAYAEEARDVDVLDGSHPPHDTCRDIISDTDERIDEWLADDEARDDNIVILMPPAPGHRWGQTPLCFQRSSIERLLQNTTNIIYAGAGPDGAPGGRHDSSKRYYKFPAGGEQMYVPLTDMLYATRNRAVRIFQLRRTEEGHSSAATAHHVENEARLGGATEIGSWHYQAGTDFRVTRLRGVVPKR